MKQHFESMYYKFDKPEHSIMPITDEGKLISECGKGYTITATNDEISQGCINRIVDNLNKLAENNSRLDATNKNGAS